MALLMRETLLLIHFHSLLQPIAGINVRVVAFSFWRIVLEPSLCSLQIEASQLAQRETGYALLLCPPQHTESFLPIKGKFILKRLWGSL